MKNARLIEVLTAVKQEDMKLFEQFILSPAINKNKRIISAFKYVESSKDGITREGLLKAGFGNEQYTDANFRMFVSEFTSLIEQFLIYKNSDDLLRKVELINFTDLKGLDKSFEKHASELCKKLTLKSTKSTKDYYILFTIESLKRNSSTTVDELTDLIYLSMKLDTAILLLSEGKTYDDTSGIVANGYLKMDINKQEHVFVYAKLLIFNLLSGEKDTSAELEELADKHSNDKEFYKYIIDTLLWYYRKSENHRKEFELIKELDNREILTLIDSRFFLMMIDAGLACNDLPDVLHLYDKYKDSVNKNDCMLGKVYIEIFKRNYDNALKALSEIEINDSFYYEQAAKIKLLIYKEQNEKELYTYTKDAYTHWKRRQLKKITE